MVMASDGKLVGELKFHAQRAAQRGDETTVERYFQVLKTLLSPEKLQALRRELKLRGRP
jgi:hypothetical protein